MAGIPEPKVFGEPVFDDLLIWPEVYGEEPLSDPEATGGQFTANAIIKKTQSGSFALDAVISSGSTTVTGSFTANAVLRIGRSGSFTANAIVRKSQSATKTVNAVIKKTTTSTFTIDAVFRKIFTVNAVIKATTSASFTAGAWIYSPRADPDGPGEPGETPMVSIIVAGVDITAHVVLHDATFTMLVNGAVGTCSLRVRDDDHIFNFTSGSEITVDIDGKRRFGGFILQPRRMFAFPVEDTTNPARPSRFITLTGVDYNILMVKRIVYNKAHPSTVELRKWAAGSDSDDVIRYTFDHYTDLGADGVTYNGVTNVGSPNPDKAGIIASGGLKFVDAMREINRLISGVFYIDAYKDLNYVDVDTPDNDDVLTDQPQPPGEYGYRSFYRLENGASLVNDAMVWGLGLGARRMAFGRSQDVDSQNLHGLWQFGEYTASLWRQASVDRRAETIVYGTDQSKRGGKDDQVSWTVTSFRNSWQAGQKVLIASEVFGKNDVVPIRRLTLTFPTKSKPQFDLVLSHEIDEPWNIFEFWFPRLPGPGEIDIDTGDGQAPEEERCDDDDFQRTSFGSVSSNPDGPTWSLVAAPGGTDWGIDGDELFVGNAGGTVRIRTPDGPWLDGDVTWVRFLTRFRLYNLGGVTANMPFFGATLTDGTGKSAGWTWQIGLGISAFTVFSSPSAGVVINPLPTAWSFLDYEHIVYWFYVRWEINLHTGQIRARTWREGETAESSLWLADTGRTDLGYGPGYQAGPFTGLIRNELLLGSAFANRQEYISDYAACGIGTDLATSGEGRRDSDGDGTTTVFRIGSGYVPATTRVYVGGYFQRPGIEYTESDPDAGEITFTTAPALGAAITIFYEVLRV